MEIINKTFKITNWTDFEEVEAASTMGPCERTVVETRIGSHPVTITTFIREDGTGHEVRSYRVAA